MRNDKALFILRYLEVQDCFFSTLSAACGVQQKKLADEFNSYSVSCFAQQESVGIRNESRDYVLALMVALESTDERFNGMTLRMRQKILLDNQA